MQYLQVRVAADGAVLSVPASLKALTTYVLLEQEGWFEKEVDFVRRYTKPGMTAIDIGANLGVYSVAMARLIGPTGAVYSFEPASITREHLSRSKDLNGCANLHIIPAAVSNRSGEAQLALLESSELNKLSEEGPGEAVQLTSLDLEDARIGWRSPDFIKIDAEGEEARIVEGGRAFFQRHSPVIMFEIKAGHHIDEGLRSLFQPLGYHMYRQLQGDAILVPDHPGEPLDPFELNLFAIKPDRASELEVAGLLTRTAPAWRPDEEARARAVSSIGQLAFGEALLAEIGRPNSLDPRYHDCLAAYATWRMPELGAPERYGALRFAMLHLMKLCNSAPSMARLSMLARAAWDAGQRTICVNAIGAAIGRYKKGDQAVKEPFWPISPRFDAISPGKEMADWLRCSMGEQLERAHAYSSCIAGSLMDLDQLCANPFVSAEMHRRRALEIARTGKTVAVPARLSRPAVDHVNADLWRAGKVPNTVVE